MKKYFAPVLIAVLLLAVGSSSALAQTGEQPVQQASSQAQIQWLTVVTPKCPCYEGENATFDISIRNVADRAFTVNAIAFADANSFVFINQNINSALAVGESKNFSVTGVLPPATRGKTLFYVPCFAVSADNQSTQNCESVPRRLSLVDKNEAALSIIYAILVIFIIVFVVFAILLFRKM